MRTVHAGRRSSASGIRLRILRLPRLPLEYDLDRGRATALHEQRRELAGLDADVQAEFNARPLRLRTPERIDHARADRVDRFGDAVERELLGDRDLLLWVRVAADLDQHRPPVSEIDGHNLRFCHSGTPY